MRHIITVYEEDGYPRRSFPTTTSITFPQGQWNKNDPARLIDSENKEVPCQIDSMETHPDGSVQKAELTFAPFLAAWQTRRYVLETSGEPAQAKVRNPISIDIQSDAAIVKQGVITCTVHKQDFNLVDTIVFRDKSYLIPNARGPVLILDNDDKLSPVGEAKITAETAGPWAGRLRVEGNYPQDFAFVTHLTFVSSKSWFLAEHSITNGDRNRIRAIRFDCQFDLKSGPLSVASGARVRKDSISTTWTVITDNVHTVDLAILNAWSRGSEYVRCETDADGAFRAIYPYADRPCKFYPHVLHGPPDDIKNTPAPAMAAELRCDVKQEA